MRASQRWKRASAPKSMRPSSTPPARRGRTPPRLSNTCSPEDHAMAKKRMVQAINEGIAEEMERDPRIILFGEDVHISPIGDTRGLIESFGASRVLNTPISETVMTGMAVGAAATGSRVICHLFYGNFIYTGFDAIANQAAKLRYMLGGQVRLPILFIAMIGGGRSVAAQHSDSMHPLLANLGGLHVVMPSSPG